MGILGERIKWDTSNIKAVQDDLPLLLPNVRQKSRR